LNPPSYSDAFLARSDLAGNFDWAVIPAHENPSGYSIGTSMYIDEAGKIYQCGSFHYDVVFGQTTLTNNDSFAVKADQNGVYTWASGILATGVGRRNDICGNSETAVVNNYYTLAKLDCATGQILDNIYPDFFPDRIHYCDATNRVITTGDMDQLVFVSAFDANLNEIWMKQFNGDSGFGHNIGTSTDYDDHFYAFSYASTNMDYFGQKVEKGLILSKQDLSGNLVWLWQFQGAKQDPYIGCYIKVDTSHHCLYITGVFTEPFVIPGETTLIPAEGGSFYILKFDLDGVFQWAIQENGSIAGNCLAVDNNGNVLLSGTFEGSSMTIGNATLVSAGADDVFIAKYDLNGNFLWAVRGGGEEIEYEGLISADAEGNIYLTGEFTSINVTLKDHSLTMEEGDGNVLVAKLSPAGDVIWMDSKAGSLINYGDYYCWPTSIITDPEGYSYIKGWHHDSTYFDGFLLTNPYSKTKKYNFFVAKFDPQGNTLWARSINESRIGFDYNQMDVDKEGNVYLGAQISDTVWFGDDYQYVSQGFYNGFRDLFVSKYSTDGDLDWVRIIPSHSVWGNASPTISCITALDDNRLIVGGKFTNQIEFTPFMLKSQNTHGMISYLGESTWIEEEWHHTHAGFDLYPNPAAELITVRLSQPDQVINKVIISDMSGRIFIEADGLQVSNWFNIDISTLPPGPYIIRINGNGILKPKKFVVQ
jgi:hypothetical protein